MCDFTDLQWMENVTSFWSINESGEPQNEVDIVGGDFSGYGCGNCGEHFTNADNEQAFIEAKAHLTKEPK